MNSKINWTGLMMDKIFKGLLSEANTASGTSLEEEGATLVTTGRDMGTKTIDALAQHLDKRGYDQARGLRVMGAAVAQMMKDVGATAEMAGGIHGLTIMLERFKANIDLMDPRQAPENPSDAVDRIIARHGITDNDMLDLLGKMTVECRRRGINRADVLNIMNMIYPPKKARKVWSGRVPESNGTERGN